MYLSSVLLAVLSTILCLLPTASTQTCDANTCLTDLGQNGPAYNTVCYVDPTDPSQFATEFEICPCSPNGNMGGRMIYTGLDNIVTTAIAPTQQMGPAFTYNMATQTFPVTMISVLNDSPVTIVQQFFSGAQLVGEITNSYTQAQSQSIFFTGISSAVTSTIDVQTSTTQTATEIDVNTLPASTVTSRCTTGILTITGGKTTTTLTVTSTPIARTINKNVITTVTTTLSCIPGPTSTATPKPKFHRSPRSVLKRAPIIEFEVPRCANTPASYITIVTSTSLGTVLATKTDTSTIFTTTTISSASQPPPTTVCSNVRGTTTITSTRTKIKTSRLTRETVTSIHSLAVVKTVVPKGLGICASAPTPVTNNVVAVTITL